MKTTIDYLDRKRIDYNISADGFITIHGDLVIDEGLDVQLDEVTEVSGSVDVSENATFTAPALTEVSGSVYVRANATFTAPALTKSGYVYVSENATFTAPALTTIGEIRCAMKILGHQATVFDGIGCVILSEKEKDGITIRHCRKSAFKDGQLVGDSFYVASKDDKHAHGETIREATEELLFKTGDRDVELYRNMPADTVKTPQDWAFVYRMVTGACQYGTRSFMASKGALKEQYTLAEIIEQTRGAYGSDRFRDVVQPKAAA